ncbi:MAG: PaaI family thioesterase [Steroidobacteraceae bacterium]|nr:PaaI family thioesterase [Steroidobacteraceae bacterium]
MPEPKLSLAEIQSFCSRSPYNAWLGVRVTAASDSGVEIEVPWRAELVGSPDLLTMHGGVLAAVIDVAAGLSLLAAIGRAGPAIDMRTDFHRAVRSGALRATGRVLRTGRTITSAEATVLDDAGRLVASGRAVYFTAET